MKRMFDITVSLFALMVLSPLFIVIALLIKGDSRGPVIYRSRRAGRWGCPFVIFKFRTMVTDAEKVGGFSTPSDDPRITRAGKFLREHKLDELPQFINVLKGEMSIVGPRPEVLPEVALYSLEERRLLAVSPGITDWASLRFHNEGEILRGSPDAHFAYREKIRPEKIRLALQYAENHSFSQDIRILFRTAAALIRAAGANAAE